MNGGRWWTRWMAEGSGHYRLGRNDGRDGLGKMVDEIDVRRWWAR